MRQSLHTLRPDELRLYLFLVLAADRRSLSFCCDDSICAVRDGPREAHLPAHNPFPQWTLRERTGFTGSIGWLWPRPVIGCLDISLNPLPSAPCSTLEVRQGGPRPNASPETDVPKADPAVELVPPRSSPVPATRLPRESATISASAHAIAESRKWEAIRCSASLLPILLPEKGRGARFQASEFGGSVEFPGTCTGPSRAGGSRRVDLKEN